MAAPFYNAIKGTTAGTPGTGAFTPNAASTGFIAWSTVASGWIGLVRFEDGSAWELSYCYWNATTLSRASTQMVSSSSGSAISLTSAATAAMVVDGAEVQPHLMVPWRGAIPVVGVATPSVIGIGAITATGTAAGTSPATTNFLTEQPRAQLTSATTANAQSAWTSGTTFVTASSTAGRGGWEFTARFGCSQIPTGPRVFAGVAGASYVVNSAEPSAHTTNLAVLGLDSTDTNLQLLVNNNSGSGTKTTTGIPLVANGWYEVTIWSDPGSLTVKMLLIRLDTGDIFYGSTASDVPVTGSVMLPQVVAGLNGTNTGTAMILHMGGMLVRTAS
jgi:hypothetical protein